ncbi:ATP-binding protein [Pseudomonas cremoricolorata]|uniref:ATP-binding protein n=1 Tax=Pseudomonas cremoricolorata TaxID=157783 RepID=UPI00048C3638|nr:ATP-binding protein [Pseudomonas cremoricolorata]
MAKWLAGGGEMAERIRHHDWSATPLGPLHDWPQVLSTSVALCLASRFPQAILWGEQLITLHNDAFTEILGDKPLAIGRPFSEVWQEAWSDIGPMVSHALSGEAVFIQDFPLLIERQARPERAYFTFCYSPIRDADGTIVGMLDTVAETTPTVLANQRLNFLDSLSRAVANATDPARILDISTQMLGQYLQLSSCAYALMDDDQDGFTISGEWVADASTNLLGRYRLRDFGELPLKRLRDGLPLVINDTLRELPLEAAATFSELGARATVCMPLIKEGRLTALMAVHDNQPRRWTGADQALIGEVIERSWAHIQRIQAHLEVRDTMAAMEALNATLEQRVRERTDQLLHTEAVLRQSQKLEAIGQLTGGVAHDFNNLLTIIRSSLHFLQRPELEAERRSRYLKTMVDTVERGAKLTGQLLAFARRQALSPQVFDAGQRLSAISEMLDTVTGARLQVLLELPQTPCYICADLGQLETALINMVINGRDAMSGEGTLRLRLTANHRLDLPGQPSPAGPFAAIEVIDQGPGIEPELLERIFDPFFTTKALGQGTGLGLSQVFGFARQSGGDVQVSSEPGQGATFMLYLPQTSAPQAAPASSLAQAQAGVGQTSAKRILVVEDNPDVGNFTTQILSEHGFQVSWADCGEDALVQLEHAQVPFDAVFSDVLMPGMGGLAMAREIRTRYSDLPVILTSGYSEAVAEGGHAGFAFLAKPYSAQQVCTLLAEVLRT